MALIDQQEAIEGVKELFSLGDCFCDEYSIVGMLNSLPTQEIIHCKDCKYWKEKPLYTYCERMYHMGFVEFLEDEAEENDFCSWAVKRGETE